MLGTILRVLALVCFLVAAAAVRTGRVNLLGVGLALWVLAELLSGVTIDGLPGLRQLLLERRGELMAAKPYDLDARRGWS